LVIVEDTSLKEKYKWITPEFEQIASCLLVVITLIIVDNQWTGHILGKESS